MRLPTCHPTDIKLSITHSHVHTVTYVLSAAMYAKGRGAGHHPPRGMHLQRGELLAYNYLHIFVDAINMIEEDLETKSAVELATSKLDNFHVHSVQPTISYSLFSLLYISLFC